MEEEIKQLQRLIEDTVNPPFTEVTRSQAAEYLGISLPNIDRLCRAGIRDKNGIVFKLTKTPKGWLLWKEVLKMKQIRREKAKRN